MHGNMRGLRCVCEKFGFEVYEIGFDHDCFLFDVLFVVLEDVF